MDYKVLLAAPLMALLVVASADEVPFPKNWGSIVGAESDKAHIVGKDTQVGYGGKPSLTIKTRLPVSDIDHALLIQTIKSFGYEGKRVRFSGQLMARGVDGWAGAWLNTNADGRQPMVNVMSRLGDPASGMGLSAGSIDWHPVDVVIDIPTAPPGYITMGLALVGNGQVWLSDLRFEEVGPEVPLTQTRIGFDIDRWEAKRGGQARAKGPPVKQRPANLSLDQ